VVTWTYSLDSVLAWMEDRPDLLYRPGPSIGLYLASRSRLALLIAANQVGKTAALCHWANTRCLAYTGAGPGVLLAMIADLDNQYPVFSAKLWEVCARSELSPDCRYIEGRGYYTHGRRLVKFRTGAMIEFRGGKGEQMSAASVTCDLGVVVDEIPQRGHFAEAMRAAQRYMAPVRVGFTAVGRPASWFRLRVEGDPDSGAPPADVDPVSGAPMWEVHKVGLSVAECPWLTSEQVALIYAQTPADEAPQRLRGEWEGPTSARVFSGMRADLVVLDPPPASYRLTVAMDHGELAGHEVVYLLYSDDRRVYVVDEYVNLTATTPEADALGIVAMLARNRAHPANVDKWVGDVNSAGKHGAGRSINDDLGRAIGAAVGAPSLVRIDKPDKRPGSVEYGTRLLNFALHRGDLVVCERARSAVRALWHHAEDGDDYTHGVDTLRYGAVEILRRRPEYAAIHWRVG
jgi:hypothetical protein